MRHLPKLLIGLVLCLCACTTQPPTMPPPPTSALPYTALPSTGDSARGKAMYETGLLGSDVVACVACHALEGAKMSGPNLGGIAVMAQTRVPGQSAEVYLFNAIVNPDDYLVPGYSKGIMPATYGKSLSPQNIRDVIDYLLTLR